jgi:hypothetical protein
MSGEVLPKAVQDIVDEIPQCRLLVNGYVDSVKTRRQKREARALVMQIFDQKVALRESLKSRMDQLVGEKRYWARLGVESMEIQIDILTNAMTRLNCN